MTNSVVEVMLDVSTLPVGTGNVAQFQFSDGGTAKVVTLSSAQNVTADAVASAAAIAAALNNVAYNGYQVKAGSVNKYLFITFVAAGVITVPALGSGGTGLTPTGTLVVSQVILDPNYLGPISNPAQLVAAYQLGYLARQ